MKTKLKTFIIITIVIILVFLVMVSLLFLKYAINTYHGRQTDGQNTVSTIESRQPVADLTEFDTSYVDELIKSVPGNVQWGLHFYNNDFEYKSPSAPVPSASVIKVFIMEYAYDAVNKGDISTDTIIGSSNLYDLIYRMITDSDNNATNQLINYFGMDNMNLYFKNSGYKDTVVQRRMLDFEAQKAGMDNYTSINDVMKFLDKVYNNKDQTPYSDMLSIMLNQHRTNKIPSALPPGIKVANKTGELSDVENDIALVFDKNGDFAVAFLMTSLTNVEAGKQAIRQCTRYIYENR